RAHYDELFFSQAEDGIRGFHVTGVQTCALPIYTSLRMFSSCYRALGSTLAGMPRIPSPLSSTVAHLVDPNGDQNDEADDDLLREIGRASCRARGRSVCPSFQPHRTAGWDTWYAG